MTHKYHQNVIYELLVGLGLARSSLSTFSGSAEDRYLIEA